MEAAATDGSLLTTGTTVRTGFCLRVSVSIGMGFLAHWSLGM